MKLEVLSLEGKLKQLGRPLILQDDFIPLRSATVLDPVVQPVLKVVNPGIIPQEKIQTMDLNIPSPTLTVSEFKPTPIVVTPSVVPVQTTALTKVTNFLDSASQVVQKVSSVASNVNQVFNPQAAPQYPQQPNTPAPTKEDNTLLYIGLGVGGVVLLTGAAILLKKKKKKGGMGRVRKAKATKSSARRKPVRRRTTRKVVRRKKSRR